MTLGEWIGNKILTPKTLDSLTEKIQDRIKPMIINALQDEDIAYAVQQYSFALGDTLYDRYKKKFFGMVGGLQKGVNYATDNTSGGIDLADIIQGGEIDVGQILTSLLLGGFSKPKPQTFAKGKIGL